MILQQFYFNRGMAVKIEVNYFSAATLTVEIVDDRMNCKLNSGCCMLPRIENLYLTSIPGFWIDVYPTCPVPSIEKTCYNIFTLDVKLHRSD